MPSPSPSALADGPRDVQERRFGEVEHLRRREPLALAVGENLHLRPQRMIAVDGDHTPDLLGVQADDGAGRNTEVSDRSALTSADGNWSLRVFTISRIASWGLSRGCDDGGTVRVVYMSTRAMILASASMAGPCNPWGNPWPCSRSWCSRMVCAM